MALNYYSILSRATQGKDAAARLRLYDEARALVARLTVGPNRTEDDIAAQADALESAISQIEDEVAANNRAEAGSERLDSIILSSGPNWGPIAATVLAVIAIIGLAASAYWYVTAQGERTASESASAPSRPSKRANIDPVVEDLRPGVDGGSSADILPFSLQRQVTYYRTTVVPRSIVVDRENRFLYLIQGDNSARRYGIGISQECLRPGSLFRITSKMEWPEWRYSAGDTKSTSGTAQILAGGPGNPLGARALLLDQPGLLIHGTNSPKTIGHLVATGCIRLVNDDVEDLYKRVSLDTKVIFRN
jgi:lipoprotein-anchoring transpeptidase ErfK/SrfK